MTPAEVRALVREVLNEQESRFERVEDAAVQRSMRATLTALGIIVSPDASQDELHKKLSEFQENIRHTDKWRKSVAQVERAGWFAVVGVLVSGFAGFIWLGFKTAVTLGMVK